MPTLTIDLTTEQAVRIQVAVGQALALERNATLQESRTFIINRIKEAVLQQERKAAEAAINNITTIDIT